MNKPFLLCEHCLRGEKGSDGNCPLCHFDGIPRNPVPMLPEGTAVGGRYILGRQEGQGGFSICYRAWDGMSDEIVAVKELFPDEVAARLDDGTIEVDPQYQEDFDAAVSSLGHEAEVLRQLAKEPAIVQVRDVFPDNETVYLAMEYLRGRSYDKYLHDWYAKYQTHLDVQAAVNVILRILGALEAVHACGLLHLDVKPANIRVLDDGRIVLLDFGSARDAFRVGNGPYGDTFTPGFAALEQYSVTGSVLAATDVYATAATLYYSLSLQVPTRADERAEGAPLPPLSACNPLVETALEAVVEKAMALDPRSRYASVSLLKQALEPFGTTDPGLPALPASQAVPAALRIVAGLLDVVTTLLFLAALTASFRVDPEQIVVAGLLIWWGTQLLPRITRATPGMLAVRLRLIDQRGEAVALKSLLLRAVMLIAALLMFRFKSDSQGLLMHDRISNSRVVAS